MFQGKRTIFTVSVTLKNKFKLRILCITRTVKHNYNSPISTVRIQLHVLAIYVGHIQVEIF